MFILLKLFLYLFACFAFFLLLGRLARNQLRLVKQRGLCNNRASDIVASEHLGSTFFSFFSADTACACNYRLRGTWVALEPNVLRNGT